MSSLLLTGRALIFASNSASFSILFVSSSKLTDPKAGRCSLILPISFILRFCKSPGSFKRYPRRFCVLSSCLRISVSRFSRAISLLTLNRGLVGGLIDPVGFVFTRLIDLERGLRGGVENILLKLLRDLESEPVKPPPAAVGGSRVTFRRGLVKDNSGHGDLASHRLAVDKGERDNISGKSVLSKATARSGLLDDSFRALDG